MTLLAACAVESPSSPGPVTLVFKHGKLSGDPRDFSAVLRDFEQDHPGLLIREELLPSSTDQQHQFYAINLEGRSPAFDVFAADVIWVQEFARAGWIQALDDLVSSRDRSEFFEGPIRAATYDDRLYAVPWYLDAGLLYYRRDLLDRYGFSPPRTWPELAQLARTILQGERDPSLKGFVWQGKQYEGLVCVALEFIRSHGGDLLGQNGTEAEAALAFMRSLIAEEVSPAMVASADEEATRHLFGAGRAIFMRNWPYVWTLVNQPDSPMRGLVGIAPLPAFPGHAPAPVLGGWMLAIPHGSAHAEEAAELVRYLTSSAVQRRLSLSLGYKPTRRTLYRDPQLLQGQPWLSDMYPVFRDARPRPVTPYYLMLSQVWQAELSAALVGLKTPAEALASARRQAGMILEPESRVAHADL
jgi:multiple sugar transport system substrate-binding protein